MLNLTQLHSILSQIVSLPDLHTIILMTLSGQLISYVSTPERPKDEIHVIVGLSVEVWQEEKHQGFGLVDSEVGRVAVLPVHNQNADKDAEPLMLLVLNSTDVVGKPELQSKGTAMAEYLSKSLSKYSAYLTPLYPTAPLPPQSAMTSPDRAR